MPKSLIILIVCLLAIGFSYSQNSKKEQLKKEYNNILKEIQDIEKMLTSTREEKEKSLHFLQSIEEKITTRSGLIRNIQEQVDFIQSNIDEKRRVVNSLNKDIEVLKKSYAEMIYNSYKSLHKKNKLIFFFSADNFNQALRRFSYLSSYAKYRQNQAKVIESTILVLEEKVADLEIEKQEKVALLDVEKEQAAILNNEKAEKNNLFSKLQEDEKKLKKDAKAKNKAAEKLNDNIQKIIEAEILAARKKAEAANKAKGSTNKVESLALTPEEKLISSDFVTNRGKLPWPVEKGHIIERFGKIPHPTVAKVYIENNGVDIKTEKDAIVRTIFNGSVVSSFYLPTTQNSVIIKHGEYYTVYSNLKTVSVGKDDKLVTKESIGTAYTDPSSGLTKVHIEVWKGMEKINPELWLGK